MFAQGLSGRHNTLSVARPPLDVLRACALPPPSVCRRPPLWYFCPVDGKEGHPALEVAVGATEASARFQWPGMAAAAARRFPKEILSAGQTQHFNYYHEPPSAWAVLHRLTQIENMLEERRDREKKKQKNKLSWSLWFLS